MNRRHMNLQIHERHSKIVLDILAKHPFKFYAFGSRAKGTARELSDLDLAFSDEIPLNILANLDEEFTESDLPFKVDIINLNNISPAFYETIKNDLVQII